MENIPAQQLADFASVVSGAPLSSPRFVRAILYSINRISRDLFQVTGGDCNVAAIDELSDDVEIDSAYQTVYEAGLMSYLQDYGEWGKQANPEAKREYQKALSVAHGQWSIANFAFGTLGNFVDYTNVAGETIV